MLHFIVEVTVEDVETNHRRNGKVREVTNDTVFIFRVTPRVSTFEPDGVTVLHNIRWLRLFRHETHGNA